MVRAVGLVLGVVLTLMPTAEEAMAQGVTLPALSMPDMAHLLDWLHSSPLHLPKQKGGLADGLSHKATSADTRSAGGRGRKPGRGKGELPGYRRHLRDTDTFTTGPAVVKGRDGFKAATSRRVADESSETSDVFENADGTKTRRVYFGRSNFRRPGGTWTAIDPTPVKAAGGRWREKANDLGVELAATADDPELASVGTDAGHAVSYSLDGVANVPGRADEDGAVRYAGVLPSTDLVLVPQSGGVKEKLVLSSSDAPASWSFTLRTKGLTPALAEDGAVEFTDASGHVVQRIPHAFMEDASVNPVSGEHATSRAVRYALAKSGGRWALKVTADTSWIKDPARTWPIVVDPTLTISDDTYAETQNTGDHSTEDVFKVGSYDAGVHSANSFLHLTGLTAMVQDQNVSAASLHLFDVWAASCTPQPFYASPVTGSWSASAVTSYPGPDWDPVLLGQLTADPGAACTNTGGDRTKGVWMTMPLDRTWFNAISTGTGSNHGIALYSTTTDTVHWKQFESTESARKPYLDLTLAANTVPQVDASYPPDNYNATTLRPELVAYGSDADDYPGDPLKYQFQVLDSATGTVISDSGLIAGGDWKVPTGKLVWSGSYLWQVRAYDGVAYSPWEQSALATVTPQPAVTSGLSQNTDGHDFDPGVGNYTTSDTDADVQTVGPSLSIERNYNSLDPRADGAFGAGWSTVADMEAAEVKDASGAVTSVNVTYPDGSQVGFGKNADGSFTPPPGRWAQLTVTTSPAGYKLVDKDVTAYVFQQPIPGRSGAYAISSITDYAGRAENFTYDGTTHLLSKITSQVSGRSLTLSWFTPAGTTVPHVQTVATDPTTAGDWPSAETWKYDYSGDALTQVCPPADWSHCTTYGYATGSHYRTLVLDADPFAYWRMGEASGTAAADAVDDNQGKLNGTYHNVSLGSAGPITGSKAASFNGTTSYVSIPSTPGATRTYSSVSLWFKTSQAGGVLFYYGDKPLTDSDPVAHTKYNTPAIYIGTNGKLHGCFARMGACSAPIQSSGTVNNNAWHQVVLTSAGNTQSMYLDGAAVGTLPGDLWSWNQPYVSFGAGLDTQGWPDMPADQLGHFNGLIAEASIVNQPLNAAAVSSQYTAAKQSAKLLQTITLPSGKTQNAVVYNPVDDTISQETDNNGGVWKLVPPTVTGSSQVYRSAVLGAGPSGYWRLAETAAAQAVNEVHTGYGSYNNVTLGTAGPFGSSDVKAASFNGTSSFAEVPASLLHATKDRSVSLWFKTAVSGVLIGDQQNPIAGATQATGSWNPVLYVGADGKLHGHFWSVSGSGGTAFSSTGTVNNNAWHHAVLSVAGSTQTMYVDGVQQATFSGIPNDQNNAHVYIGAGFAKGWYQSPSDISYFNGSIAEVAFFDQGLTTAQVSQEWTAFKSSSGVAPVRTVKVQVPTQDGSTKYVTYGYDVDNGGRVLSQTDPLGGRTTYGYDTSGFLYTVTDPNGNTTTTGHDVRGNVVSKTTCQNQAANACATEYYTYYPDDTTANPAPDPRNDLVLTSRDGRSSGPTDTRYLTTYSYDQYGNQTGETTPPVPGFPAGRTSSTTYTTATTPADGGGNAPPYLLASTTTPGGAVTSYTYNSKGDLTQQTDANGASVGYGYDNIGRLTSKKEISDSYPAGLVTSYAYDKDDQVTTETDPAVTNRVTGAVHTAQTVTDRDVDGNVTAETISDLTGGDGKRRTEWTYDSANRVHTQDEVAAFNADGTVKTRQTTTYGYNVYGNVVSEVDAVGNETDYTFDVLGRQLTTTQPNFTGDPDNPSPARTLTLDSRAYDPAGRLASVTDSMGWTTSYTYTDDGQVATVTRTDAVTDPQHPQSFVQQANTYDAAGNLIQQVSNNGATTTAYTVDAADRTTVTTLDPAGLARTSTVSYDPDDHVVTSTRSGTTGTPETTTYTYDALGNSTSSTAHDGTTAPVGRWKLNETSGTSAADSSGGANTATTGSAVTWSTDHGGSAVFNGTSNAYAETSGPAVDTAVGFTVSAWVKLASTAANSTFVSQNGDHTSAFQLYYSSGAGNWAFGGHNADTDTAAWTAAYGGTPVVGQWTHLVGVFDAAAGQFNLYVNGALSSSKAFTTPWNSDGTLDIARKLSSGTWSEYANGSISDAQVYSEALTASQVSSLYGGTLPASGSTVRTTRQHLDQRGLATWSSDEKGNVTSYSYDEAGNLSQVVAPTVNVETADPATGTTTVSAQHPVSSTGYNTFGEAAESKDPNGNVSTTGYDPLGQQVSQTLPSYTPPGSATPITPATSTEYNSIGQITAETDALQNRTTYTYDQLGDQVDTTLPGGRTTHSVYDTDGDLLSETDPTGATTQATYDYLGREQTTTQVERKPSQAAYTTVNHYDAPHGWLTSSVSPSGVTTSFGYNAAGEQTTVTDGANNPTTYGYDLAGRQNKVTNPDGTSTSTTYDVFGNPVGTAEADTTGMVRRTTSAEFDPAGNMISSTDGNRHTTRFTLDATGMVTKEVQPVSASESITTSFGYDAAGNRTRFTDGRGVDATGNPVAGHDFLTTYNRWNLPESLIEPSTPAYPALADRTFTTGYDADGRVAQQLSPGGVTVSNTYDEVGQLTRQSGTGAEAATLDHTFGYDAAGHITSSAAPGTDDTFSYDDRGDLLSTAGPSGASSFAYDGDGRMTARTDAAGTSNYGYDTAGRLKTVNDAATGSTATISYNLMSLPSDISYGTGKAHRALGYDWAHRLTSDILSSPSGATEASIAYDYDQNDNETSKTTTGVAGAGTSTYTYDWADRLKSWNNGASTVTYGYDASGNRTQAAGDTYTYDARNELTSDGHNSYAYTARGTLRSTTDEQSETSLTVADAFNRVVNSGTVAYTYDGLDRVLTANGGLSQQSFVYTGTGNDLASDGGTTYSRDPGGGLFGINASGVKVLAMTDLHDDLVGQFTDSGSALTGSTTYDPFGKIVAGSGMLGHLGYQSEWTDPDTDQVDMAARWYNPDTGQFTSRDTVGLNPVPDSVNADRFAYADDNPLTTTDPTGHWGWSSFTHAVSHAWHSTTKAVSSSWSNSWSYAALNRGWDLAKSTYHAAKKVAHQVKKHGVVGAAKHYARKAVRYIRDSHPRLYHYVAHQYHRARHYVHKKLKAAKKKWHAAVKAAKSAGKALGHQLKRAKRAAGNFVKKHKTAIVGTLVGLAVVGAAACVVLTAGACIGAIGGAMLEGAAMMGTEGAIAGVIGAAITEGGSAVIGAGIAAGAGGSAAAVEATVGDEAATAGSATRSAGAKPPVEDEPPVAGRGSAKDKPGGTQGRPGAGCTTVPHSFTAATRVLLASGASKPISAIKVGDLVKNAAPAETKNEVHRVDRVIVTKTDRDFTDITVATKSGPKVIHTTKHHQFYDATTNAWTQAAGLKAHHKLQNASGSTTEILNVRSYTATRTTYDLTIDGLHTYYVVAGGVPILVHNTNCPTVSKGDIQGLHDRARSLYGGLGQGKATVSVARVWNSATRQTEEWVATHMADLPASVAKNLNGAIYKFGDGDAEATIVGALGDEHTLLGIASSTRICPSCFATIRGVPGMIQTTIGRGAEDLPDYTEWRTAINRNFWDGT
ncbi:LamG-like jellyroll fold domain-containing protein [Streptomyces sp. NPDC001070]